MDRWDDNICYDGCKTEDEELALWRQTFVDKAMVLIRHELENPTEMSTSVLFGDELGASDWTPADAVACLFRYASRYGWGEED